MTCAAVPNVLTRQPLRKDVDEIRFSIDGYQLRRTYDREYVVSCAKEAAVLSVDETERNLSDLWIDGTAETISRDFDSGFMDNEAFELVRGNKRAGMLWMGKTEDQFTREEIGFLLGVYVSPEYRSKGLGRALLESAEEWCREKGLLHLSLNVGKANADAVKLYKSAGFAERSAVMRKLI